MEEPKLSSAERVILANQSRILSFLDEQNSEDHQNDFEILSRGYTGLYYKIFDRFSEEHPQSVTREVEDILSMFFMLSNYINELKPEEKAQLNLRAFEFEGFDGNHDPHYSQARFMVKRLDLFEELKDRDINSHNQISILRYRRMLPIYNEVLKAPEGFTLENFQRIQAAALR